MAASVDQKLLKATKFPPEFNQKVDMQKVNLEVMKKWIAGKISKILGNEDDVVIELCFNLIEGSRFPDIKKLQIQLTGFLEKDTPKFCQELWKLCLSAQGNPQGVPKELLEAKKLELIQEKIEAEKAAEEARRRRETSQRRDREIDAVRNRERADHGRGGGRGDSWRGSRGDRNDRGFDRGGRDGGRDFDHRGHRRSRSPPPRRRDSRARGFRGPPASREADTYVPGNRGGRRRDEPRRRSPLASSPTRLPMSRSPTPRRRRLVAESQSPPRQRRRSVSRSPSPDRTRRHYRGRGGRGDRGRSSDRRRSYTPSEVSRSPSPRPRKRRRPPTRSPSLSPPPRQRQRGRHDSSSRSRSRSSRTSSQRLSFDERDIIRTGNDRKGREHDERRLTRSNSGDRSITPPRRRRRSPSRNRSRSPSRRDQKRRRSIERYAPERRRRNTSSVSLPTDTRDKRADISEDDDIRRSPIHDAGSKSPVRDRDLRRATELEETKSPEKEASELREKLLREKIMKMRTSSANPNNA